MPTVQNRLEKYGYGQTISQFQREQLGKLIAKAYQLSPVKEPILRRESKEPTGTYQVCDYHPDFKTIMDGVILNFCRSNNIRKSFVKRQVPIKKVPRGTSVEQKNGRKIVSRSYQSPAKNQPAYSVRINRK